MLSMIAFRFGMTPMGSGERAVVFSAGFESNSRTRRGVNGDPVRATATAWTTAAAPATIAEADDVPEKSL